MSVRSTCHSEHVQTVSKYKVSRDVDAKKYTDKSSRENNRHGASLNFFIKTLLLENKV